MNSKYVTRALRFLGVLLLLYALLLIAVPMLIPDAIVRAPNFGVEEQDLPLPNVAAQRRLGIDRTIRFPVGPPSATLTCFILDPSSRPPRGVLLLLHGHRDNKENLLPIARRLADAGYRVVLPDHRGHGLATGDYLTFGVVEKEDMRMLLNRLESEGILEGRVAVLGFSYGGSVAVQLGAVDKRVGAIVSVSTFSSLREVVPDYVERFLPFLAPCLEDERIEEAVTQAGRRAGFDADLADTKSAARHLSVPLLIIHGRADRRIPLEHALRLDSAAGGIHRLMIFEGRSHGDIMTGETGEKILDEALTWFDTYLDSAGAATAEDGFSRSSVEKRR